MIMLAPLHSSWKAPVSMIIYNYVDASTEKGRGSTQDFKMFKIYRFVRTWVFFHHFIFSNMTFLNIRL